MAGPWEKYAAPAAQTDTGPWTKYAEGGAAPAAEKSSTVGDVVKSLGSGIVRGAVETAMFPVTAKRLLDTYATPYEAKVVNAVRGAFGYDPIDAPTPEQLASEPVQNVLNSGQDIVRTVMDDQLHTPETTAGKVFGTIGEFMPPGAWPSKAARLAPTVADKAIRYAEEATGNVLAPALASEAAGQATEGTSYEGPARFAGALFGNASAAATRAHYAPDAAIRRSTEGMTDEDWQRALDLQNNRTGIDLSSPEAIAQARGGASKLPDLLRIVEGSQTGGAITGPFFAARPAQVDTAVGGVLDKIAPQSTQPSVLGPRAADAAEKALAASPEGQALTDAIFGAGPRTTALEAGTAIQVPLRSVYDRREGARAALGDKDYNAARNAEPTIPVADLVPETTTVRPAYTSIKPVAAEGDSAAAMVPEAVPAKTQTPALTSNTGPTVIQADPRGVLQFIDDLAPTTKASARAALQQVRASLFDKGGVDTSVTGLDATRNQLGDMINVATRSGENHTANVLQQVKDKLDQTLADVPEYRRATKNFQAASEPLEPFSSPGMSGVIERDAYNKRFTSAPENVPAALSTPSEARNFNAVAPTEARIALENHLATQILDKATDANGAVNADQLALALRDNQDVLAQFPAVAERLSKIVDASNAAASARTGTVGRIAAAKDTATAGNAILPQNPLAGSGAEAADAVRRIAAEDPETTAALVRQNLADRYAAAQTETQGGSREGAGAKFHKNVAGNDVRQEVLDAVLTAIPGGQPAAAAMSELLDVLQATMRRKAEGSPTEVNRMNTEELGTASPQARLFDLARTLGGSFLTQAGDATKRATLRNSMSALADILTGPNAVERTRAAADRRPRVSYPEALARTAVEAGQTLDDPRGGRKPLELTVTKKDKRQ